MADEMPLGGTARQYARAALAARDDAGTTWITQDGKRIAAVVPCDVALRGDWRKAQPGPDADVVAPPVGEGIQGIQGAQVVRDELSDFIPLDHRAGPPPGWTVAGASYSGAQTVNATSNEPGWTCDPVNCRYHRGGCHASLCIPPGGLQPPVVFDVSPGAGRDGTRRAWMRHAISAGSAIVPADDSQRAMSDAQFVAAVLGLPVQDGWHDRGSADCPNAPHGCVRCREPRHIDQVEYSRARGGQVFIDQHGRPFADGDVMTISTPSFYRGEELPMGSRWRFRQDSDGWTLEEVTDADQ